jgi:DNA-binding beta-propeller fold protein YncE
MALPTPNPSAATPRHPARRAARRGRVRPRLERLEDRVTPSTLIPVPSRHDLVYDGVRGLLYLTTSTGALVRYDVQAHQLLSPFAVGTNLNGADITPDGQYLYITESQQGATQGFVHKVNLDDGTVTKNPWAGRAHSAAG